MTEQTESSMNKFTRLFKDHPTIAAKAKAKMADASLGPVIDTTAIEVTEMPVIAAATASEDSATAVPAKPPRPLKPTRKSQSKPAKPDPQATGPKRKRGRPANGKRSNPGWFGRTFYIRKDTDERLEQALYLLKRSGIEVDKSQLADALLNAWAAVELGQADDFPISAILEKPEAAISDPTETLSTNDSAPPASHHPTGKP
jgi:hypothetical protein